MRFVYKILLPRGRYLRKTGEKEEILLSNHREKISGIESD